MLEEESCGVNLTTECNVESSKKNGKKRENKREQLLSEGADAEELTELRSIQFELSHLNSDAGKSRSRKKRKKSTKHCLEDSIKVDASEYDFKAVSSMEGIPYPDVSNAKNEAFENKQIIAKDAEDGRVNNIVSKNYGNNLESCGGKVDQRIIKKKKTERLLKEAAKANMRGICYLSRVPPHMDPLKLRQILTQYGELQRIYLVPEDSASQVQRKRAGGFRGQFFSEGWVEFTDKRVAKKVANMLNGEQTGGKKRSSFYYDIWNIKYLSKFKWDDLTEETGNHLKD